MKRLLIKNFGPIRIADITLGRLNIFIGPQSAGKSTLLKLACHCDWLERQVIISQDPEIFFESSSFVNGLVSFHKLDGYIQVDSYIRYENDALTFEYDAKTQTIKYSLTEDSWDYKRTKISYIPSERNIVSAIDNWFQIKMERNNIQSFMEDWEYARRHYESSQAILDLPFSYRYNPNDKSDNLVISNGQEIKLSNASSGLQSLVPMSMMLNYLTDEFFKMNEKSVEEKSMHERLDNKVAEIFPDLSVEKQKSIVENMLKWNHSNLYIEEPEAHLFPNTQKRFIYSLVEMLNGPKKHNCCIATHSPYILTTINNLILAGEISSKSRDYAGKVQMRFDEKQQLHFRDVTAFYINDGTAVSIMDDESKLIAAEAIDGVSEDIEQDLEYLLGI